MSTAAKYALIAVTLITAPGWAAARDLGPDARDLARVLGRLPPGVRPASGDTPPATAAAERGARLRERVDLRRADGTGSPPWLEIEYTIDPDLDARVRRVLERARVALAHVILMDPEHRRDPTPTSRRIRRRFPPDPRLPRRHR